MPPIRNRKQWLKDLDLGYRCPRCGHKIEPHERALVDSTHERCPNCKEVFDVVVSTSSMSYSPPSRE